MHLPFECHFTRRTFVRLMAAGGLLPWVDSRPVKAWAQTAAPAYSYPVGLPGRVRWATGCSCGTATLPRTPGTTLAGCTRAKMGMSRTGRPAAWGSMPWPGRGHLRRVGDPGPGRHRPTRTGSDRCTDTSITRSPWKRGNRHARPIAGTVLPRTDGLAPSHLHFELRTFFTTPEVNGNRPATGSPAASTARPVLATGRSTHPSIRPRWAGATRPTSSTAAPGRTAFRKGSRSSSPRPHRRARHLDRAI